MECRFFLVRTAAKFTFRFTNRRSGAVTIDSIAVSDIAEESYLMPHKLAPTMTFRATSKALPKNSTGSTGSKRCRTNRS